MNKYSLISKIRGYSKQSQIFWLVHYGVIPKVVAQSYEADCLKSGLDAYDYFCKHGMIQSFFDYDVGAAVFDLKKEGFGDKEIMKRIMVETRGRLNPYLIKKTIDKYNMIETIQKELSP